VKGPGFVPPAAASYIVDVGRVGIQGGVQGKGERTHPSRVLSYPAKRRVPTGMVD